MRTLFHLLSFKHIFPSNIDIKGVSKQSNPHPELYQSYRPSTSWYSPADSAGHIRHLLSSSALELSTKFRNSFHNMRPTHASILKNLLKDAMLNDGHFNMESQTLRLIL